MANKANVKIDYMEKLKVFGDLNNMSMEQLASEVDSRNDVIRTYNENLEKIEEIEAYFKELKTKEIISGIDRLKSMDKQKEYEKLLNDKKSIEKFVKGQEFMDEDKKLQVFCKVKMPLQKAKEDLEAATKAKNEKLKAEYNKIKEVENKYNEKISSLDEEISSVEKYFDESRKKQILLNDIRKNIEEIENNSEETKIINKAMDKINFMTDKSNWDSILQMSKEELYESLENGPQKEKPLKTEKPEETAKVDTENEDKAEEIDQNENEDNLLNKSDGRSVQYATYSNENENGNEIEDETKKPVEKEDEEKDNESEEAEELEEDDDLELINLVENPDENLIMPFAVKHPKLAKIPYLAKIVDNINKKALRISKNNKDKKKIRIKNKIANKQKNNNTLKEYVEKYYQMNKEYPSKMKKFVAKHFPSMPMVKNVLKNGKLIDDEEVYMNDNTPQAKVESEQEKSLKAYIAKKRAEKSNEPVEINFDDINKDSVTVGDVVDIVNKQKVEENTSDVKEPESMKNRMKEFRRKIIPNDSVTYGREKKEPENSINRKNIANIIGNMDTAAKTAISRNNESDSSEKGSR